MLLDCTFDFFGIYLVVTAFSLVLTAGYCWLPSSYWWLLLILVVTVYYHSLLLIPNFSMNIFGKSKWGISIHMKSKTNNGSTLVSRKDMVLYMNIAIMFLNFITLRSFSLKNMQKIDLKTLKIFQR